ncbi:hypothetical protein B0H14DRAFT_1452714 [Mycena olivaceomarginata]|nr:hypothetical protein B0H14DRAFT_1452714 [Mycena olivaceomarginata]
MPIIHYRPGRAPAVVVVPTTTKAVVKPTTPLPATVKKTTAVVAPTAKVPATTKAVVPPTKATLPATTLPATTPPLSFRRPLYRWCVSQRLSGGPALIMWDSDQQQAHDAHRPQPPLPHLRQALQPLRRRPLLYWPPWLHLPPHLPPRHLRPYLLPPRLASPPSLLVSSAV